MKKMTPMPTYSRSITVSMNRHEPIRREI